MLAGAPLTQARARTKQTRCTHNGDQHQHLVYCFGLRFGMLFVHQPRRKHIYGVLCVCYLTDVLPCAAAAAACCGVYNIYIHASVYIIAPSCAAALLSAMTAQCRCCSKKTTALRAPCACNTSADRCRREVREERASTWVL